MLSGKAFVRTVGLALPGERGAVVNLFFSNANAVLIVLLLEEHSVCVSVWTNILCHLKVPNEPNKDLL